MPKTQPFRLTAFRDSVLQLLEEAKILLPRVKECADRVSLINALVDRRLEIQSHPSRAADDVGGECKTITQQIEDLHTPFPGVKAQVQAFVDKLLDTLRTVPVEPPKLLMIRDEILCIPLCETVHEPLAFSMIGAHRDLQSIGMRIQDLLDSLETPGQTRALAPHTVPKVRVIRLPEGANWSDITIRFTSDHAFQVGVYGEPGEFRNYTEAGFENAKNNKPVSSWQLLNQLASRDGEIPRPRGSREDVRRVEKQIQELRRRLKVLFGLPQDPFWPYRKVNCYRTRFSICRSESTAY